MRSITTILVLLSLASCKRVTAPAANSLVQSQDVAIIESAPAFEDADIHSADLGVVIDFECLSGADRGRFHVFFKRLRESEDDRIESARYGAVALGNGGYGRLTNWHISGSRAQNGVNVHLDVSWTGTSFGYTGEAKGVLFVPWMGKAETLFDPELLVSARFVTPPNFDK